mmetsp:Transcript_36186/g.116201  ORF Transcript_36186/g.116201 Transcript_36186/m.116201 type:complete len:255 (+) Transcript_36186:276-1040(+)
MMIWSTRKTVTAASVAWRIASFLVQSRSSTPVSASTLASTTLMPALVLPALCAAYSSATMLAASRPAFSASVRGTTSRARPYLLMAYWSSPGCASAYCCSASARRSSAPPAPGRKRASRVMALITLTPSSMARSTSSMMFGDEPRTTMVATFELSPLFSRMVHIVDPISRMWTCSHSPMSAGSGGSIRTRLLAPVVRQIRRSSNLDGHFITMILCFSQKWSASSPTACPHTIMLTPVAAIALMVFSSASSSESL